MYLKTTPVRRISSYTAFKRKHFHLRWIEHIIWDPLSLEEFCLSPLNTKVKVLNQTFGIQTYLLCLLFSFYILGSELRHYQEKAQCHHVTLLMVFWLKGGKVLTVDGMLIVPYYKEFRFLIFSPNAMEYGVYCNNII